MPEKTDKEKLDAYNKMVAGAIKGGQAQKHFTPESKQRQIEGATRGGKAEKHFTLESKDRQIRGTGLGGEHSHINKDK